MLKQSCLVLAACSLMAGVASAQKGVVMTQKMVNLEEDAIESLIAQQEFDDADAMASFLFNVPFERLAASQKQQNSDPGVYSMVMHLQAQKARMDMDSPMGKMTMIIREDLDKMYNIMWAKKMYMEMSLKQIRDMRKGVMESMPQMQNMPDISKMLEQLPPEAREKALEAMKKSGQMQHMQHQQAKQEQHAEKSGRKRTISDFACEEWIVRDGSSMSSYWVTLAKPELSKRMQEYGQILSNGMGMKEDESSSKEIWEIVPGSMPIESRTVEQQRGGATMDVALVESIEEKSLDAALFELPEGLKPGSMFDMMNMSPGKKEQD